MYYRKIQCQCQVEHFTVIAKDTEEKKQQLSKSSIQDISGY